MEVTSAVHYGRRLVAVNAKMDAVRREECLCLGCDNLQSCKCAGTFFALCEVWHMALMVTRCPGWKAQNSTYKEGDLIRAISKAEQVGICQRCKGDGIVDEHSGTYGSTPICPLCKGTGEQPLDVCSKCEGTGKDIGYEDSESRRYELPCAACGGSGRAGGREKV